MLNFILVVSDNKLRHEEIPYRVRGFLDQLEVAKKHLPMESRELSTFMQSIVSLLNFTVDLSRWSHN